MSNTIADLAESEKYLRCKANELLRRAERQVLINVPRAAVDGGIDTSYQFEGRRGAAASEFSAALIALEGLQRAVESELSALASDVRILRITLARYDNAAKADSLRAMASNLNHMAGCFSSIVGLFTSLDVTSPMMNCALASSNISTTLELSALTNEDIQFDEGITWETMKTRINGHADAIATAADEFDKQNVLLRGALASLEQQRSQGQRELAKAMMQGTNAAGAQFAVNTVMRRRYNTLRIRYERARQDAVRMAWIARLAIEQRLGFKLEWLKTDLALVEAPSHWADAVCTSTGIDYERIRSEGGLSVDEYADAYIGDYVRRLELVTQSYEHDFPFTDSKDTAVVSLRDDVLRVRESCEQPVNNLLAYSARFDVPIDPAANASSIPVWESVNCPPVGGTTVNCINVTPLGRSAAGDIPIPEPAPETGDVPPYRITFAPGSSAVGCNYDSVCNAGEGQSCTDCTSFRNGATVSARVQRVFLAPGYYRLSWYGRDGASLQSENAVKIRINTTEAAPEVGAVATVDPPVGWDRHHFLFRIPNPGGTYQVALVPAVNLVTEHSVDLAGVMLEDLSGLIRGEPGLAMVDPLDYPPGSCVATQQAGIGLAPVCEDTDGSTFRMAWSRACTQLCPTGFGACEEGQTHCYRWLKVPITLVGIEQGGLLSHSGFAYGNYNYRIDSVALNFAGTGLRDCTQVDNPSTCYGSGNLPYSLIHLGEYNVRNHRGEVYAAPLYAGRIEHGRALAAERYVSNPISGADRAMLQDYWRRELRGRPITGDFEFRVWEADGLVFSNIEDVQLVIDYRYWTRFE